MSEWQPIETAPKKGYLLGYCPDESMTPEACIIVVWWEEKLGRWHSDFACDEGGTRPTHWMPLPDPPQETAE